MAHVSTSTSRARRLRERRARGVVMVAPVEVGQGGIELLVGNGLLKQHQAGDRHAVGKACLAALEQWAAGQGARSEELKNWPNERANDMIKNYGIDGVTIMSKYMKYMEQAGHKHPYMYPFKRM